MLGECSALWGEHEQVGALVLYLVHVTLDLSLQFCNVRMQMTLLLYTTKWVESIQGQLLLVH